ncbi:hypothetical protein ACK3TF_001072 [Chlorella vulgaris]
MGEPFGLHLSLDDLISKQNTQQREQNSGYGKQQRSGRSGGRHHTQQGGRGGRSQGGRSQGGHGSGRTQQQQPRQQQDYHTMQSCYQEEGDGDYVFRYRSTDVVRIDAAGNITLQSGGHYNAGTLASLNDALNLIGIRVTCPSGDVRAGEWSISDGRSLTRFHDGVVLPAKGPQQAGRGRQLLVAFNNPHHAQQAAATAASNAAATAAGVLPFLGFIPPGIPASRPAAAMQTPGRGGGAGSVFSRLGGAQGGQRYSPY